MADMTAEQAMFLLQNVYMGALKNESRITRKVLEAVPAAKAEYRPDPVSKSAMELVRHIATSDPWFVEAVTTGEFRTTPANFADSATPQEIAARY